MMTTSAGTLAIVEKSAHRLAFYGLVDGALISDIPLPHYPHEMVVTADLSTAFIGIYGVRNAVERGEGGAAIAVVDLKKRMLVRMIDCRPHHRIHGLALHETGLFALSETSDLLLGFDNPGTDATPSRAVTTGGLKGHLFALSADGAWAYCSNLLSHTISKVAPRDASVVPVLLTPGRKPEGLWLSKDGRRLYVVNREADTLVEIDTADMTMLRDMRTRRDPLRVYGVDDDHLLIANCGQASLSLVDRRVLAEVRHLDLDGIPVAAHIAGETAWVSLTTDRCLEIDLRAFCVKRSYLTGAEPDCCVLLSERTQEAARW